MRKKITVKQHDGNIEGYKLIIREIYEAGHPQEYMENFNTKFYNNDMTLTCKKMVKRIEELKSEGAELLVDKNNKYVLIYDYSEDKTTIFDMKCNGNYVNYIYGKIKELNYEDVVYYIENK